MWCADGLPDETVGGKSAGVVEDREELRHGAGNCPRPMVGACLQGLHFGLHDWVQTGGAFDGVPLDALSPGVFPSTSGSREMPWRRDAVAIASDPELRAQAPMPGGPVARVGRRVPCHVPALRARGAWLAPAGRALGRGIDMNEDALVIAEKPDLAAHRASAQMGDPDRGPEPVWKGYLGMMVAVGLCHAPDFCAAPDVEPPASDRHPQTAVASRAGCTKLLMWR